MTKQEEMHRSLIKLAKNQDFAAFISTIRMMQDAAVDGMEGASTEKLHQIAGAISVYRAIITNYERYQDAANKEGP